MNKKIISAVLAVLMMSSTAALAASAAEVEAEPSKDSGKIQFDLGDWNHDDKICFYIWDSTTNEFCSKNGWSADNAWGSKTLVGTAVEGEDGIVESYEIDLGGREDHNVFVIFHDKNTNAQTYDCVLKADAFGHKAYKTGVDLENPVDSEKTATEAVFDGVDPSVCGPYKQVTSTGNVVGNCIAPQDDGAKIVAKYIYSKLGVVDKGGQECVTDAKVQNALSEFGTNADAVWAEFQNYFDAATESGHNAEKDAEAKKFLGIADDTPAETDSAAETDTATDSTAATDSDKASDTEKKDTDTEKKDTDTEKKDTDSSTSSTTSTGGTNSTTTTTTTNRTTTTTTTNSANNNATASAAADAATGDTTGTAAFGVVLAAAAATMFLARKKVED